MMSDALVMRQIVVAVTMASFAALKAARAESFCISAWELTFEDNGVEVRRACCTKEIFARDLMLGETFKHN